MCFNVAAGNTDDHNKNFSFIMHVDGHWELAPAYDITRCPKANNGYHASLLNGREKPETDDFTAAGADAGLTKRQVLDIIQEIREAIKEDLDKTFGANISCKKESRPPHR